VLGQEKAASTIDEIRGFLRTRLPDYMVPTFLVELEHMPVLPSGKIDRLALPAASPILSGSCHVIIRPRGETEERLCAIWREVLERDDFGVEDDFFDLGGHSLSAMRVLARVRRDFLVDIPIRRLFDNPTIAAFGVDVEKHREAAAGVHLAPIAASTQASPALINALRAGLISLSPEQVNALVESVMKEMRSKI
jgi:aryl carrier-like protein